MTAIEDLLQWDRKYYRFTIGSNGHIQPGSGWYVEMCGGGRKVLLCEDELDKEDEDGRNIRCTLDELINEAIRQWHSDPEPKNHRVFYRSAHSPKDVEIKYWHQDTAMAKIVASNEAEAKKKLADAFGDLPFEIIQVWEVTDKWSH